MKFIDLSVPIDERNPEVHLTRIKRIAHRDGVTHLNKVLQGKTLFGTILCLLGKRLIKHTHLPDGEFLSLEMISCSVHTGTHVDAPFHFGSKCEGERSPYIEDLPLEWFFNDGVVLDLTHKNPPDIITDHDIEAAFAKINYSPKPLDIVLLRTGADKYFGTEEYMRQYCGVSPTAIEWLLNRGVCVIGIDAPGFDRPYAAMIDDFSRRGDSSVLWPAHFCGRKRKYAHIERLANLEMLPQPYGFKVVCFPILIKKVGASFTRVIAIIP